MSYSKELLDALKKDDVAEIQHILSFGDNEVDETDEEGNTIFHLAAIHGAEKTLKALLPLHPALATKQNSKGHTPLISSILARHQAIAEWLIQFRKALNISDNQGYTALHHAVIQQNIFLAKILLDNLADPNRKNENGFTPIDIAALNDFTALMVLLLERGANPVDALKTCEKLRYSAGNESKRILNLMSDFHQQRPVETKKKPLTFWEWVIYENKITEAPLLLSFLSEPLICPIENLIEWAMSNNKIDFLQLVILGEYIKPSLVIQKAMLARRTDLVEDLLKPYVDINGVIDSSNGMTLLHLAITLDSIYGDKLKIEDSFTLIILRQTNLNIDVIDKHGNTPLHYAVAHGCHPLVELLVKHGAQTNIQSSAQPITTSDARFNNVDKWTPLHWTAAKGNFQTAIYLLDQGADATLSDNQGRAPATLAKLGGYDKLASLLHMKETHPEVYPNFMKHINRVDEPVVLKYEVPAKFDSAISIVSSQWILDMAGQNLTDKKFKERQKVLIEEITVLPVTVIDLSDNRFTNESGEQIERLMGSSPDLKYLILSNNPKLGHKSHFYKPDVHHSLPMPQSKANRNENAFARSLVFHLTGLPDAMSSLGPAIYKHKTLEYLALDKVGFEDEDVYFLKAVLKNHPSVRYLSLKENRLTDQGVQSLIEMLDENTLIESINISDNNRVLSAIKLNLEEKLKLRKNDKELNAKKELDDVKDRLQQVEKELEIEKKLHAKDNAKFTYTIDEKDKEIEKLKKKIEYMENNTYRSPDIINAVYDNNLSAIQNFLSQNSDPNLPRDKKNRTALHIAVRKRCVDAVRMLLKGGQDFRANPHLHDSSNPDHPKKASDYLPVNLNILEHDEKLKAQEIHYLLTSATRSYNACEEHIADQFYQASKEGEFSLIKKRTQLFEELELRYERKDINKLKKYIEQLYAQYQDQCGYSKGKPKKSESPFFSASPNEFSDTKPKISKGDEGANCNDPRASQPSLTPGATGAKSFVH